ncbi:MAG: beta-galactosidase, partial [Verrucomicrobiota bacterium]|nr:beta-galactosidase [Verrucomicrobiota bacterium]
MNLKLISFLILLTRFVAIAENTSIKRPLRGLATMGSSRDLRNGQFNALKEARVHPGIYSGVVICTTWGMLEPERGTYDFSSIEMALDDIRQYNKEYPESPMAGKLRISPAMNSPEWLLKLAGGPVEIILNSGRKVKIGLYWTTEYRQAWKELQQNLAERYDDHDLVREVTVNSGATITGEPFISILNKPTVVNLHAKGYTDSAFKNTLEGALEDYAPWKKTVLDFSFNVLHETDGGRRRLNMDFTLSLMKKFRMRYGDRAVIANHGLQAHLEPAAVPIYKAFLELGVPIAAQTVSQKTLTDESIQVGITAGFLTVPQLEQYHPVIKANLDT